MESLNIFENKVLHAFSLETQFISRLSFIIVGFKLYNTWYVSNASSDDNDCHSASAPCRNLQTVLDRATDGADIYVTSHTLSLDSDYLNECEIGSPLSYTLSHLDNKLFTVTCQTGNTLIVSTIWYISWTLIFIRHRHNVDIVASISFMRAHI